MLKRSVILSADPIILMNQLYISRLTNIQLTRRKYVGTNLLFLLFFFFAAFLTPRAGIAQGCTNSANFVSVQDPCSPRRIVFTNISTPAISYIWDFGDGSASTMASPSHVFPADNVYKIKLKAYYAGCVDSISYYLPVLVTPKELIINSNTTICKGQSVTLTANGIGSSCWMPDPTLTVKGKTAVVTPTTTTTYVYNTKGLNYNYVVNGDFSSDTTGVLSDYIYDNSPGGRRGEGYYSIGTNPKAWHQAFSTCEQHTAGTSAMMIINGDVEANKKVWHQTIKVLPNTNYVFSTWLSTVNLGNPAKLQFSINGVLLGQEFNANDATCVWDQFHALWNSGNNTTATIAIINKNTIATSNDFALDDITFAEPTLKTDSVTIIVKPDPITVSIDTSVCSGTVFQLPNGTPITQSGLYAIPYSEFNCDSVIYHVTLTVLTVPAAQVNFIQPSCNVSTGSITITSPNANDFVYSINGSPFKAGLSYNNVVAGTYTIVAKNQRGCLSPPTSVTIVAQPGAPAAPLAVVTEANCTVATGTVTVSTPIGPDLSYSIDGVNYQAGLVFSKLNAGTYSLTVKNAAGCISPSTGVTVNVPPPTPVAPAANAIQPTCSVAMGTITITAPLGSNFTYSIDGNNYQPGVSFTNVIPGTYNVTVKNIEGCISPAASIIINPQPNIPAAPSVTVNQPACSIATGTITVSSPIASGLTYSINGITYQPETIFSNLAPGTYSITVKNLAGCVSPVTSVTINAKPQTPSVPTATVTNPTCTVATGTISVSTPVSTGLMYSIDGITYQQEAVFNNINAGTYSVSVKNLDGCISPATNITVNAQPPTPAALTTVVTQPTCTVATGTITVSAPAANGLSYSIDGVNYQAGLVFNNVTPGTFTLTVKNTFGCISPSTSVVVNTQPPTPIAPTATVIHPTCTIATGTITVSTSATSGLAYSLDGINYQSSLVFNNVAAGSYSLKTKNSFGCISPSTSVTVNAQPPTPTAPVAAVTQPTCVLATGLITVASPLGTGLSYSINGGNYSLSPVFSNLIAGVYSLTVKNAEGCISPATSFIVNAQPPTPAAPIASVTHPTCTIATGTVTISTPVSSGLTYSIDGVNFQAGTIFSNVVTGTYNLVVKNQFGCISPVTNVTVNAQPITPAAPAATIMHPTCTTATGTITVTSPLGTGLLYSINGSSYNSTPVFSSLTAGTYSLTVKNADGCISPATSITVNTQPPTPTAPIATITQPSCITATGTITISTPIAGGLTYSINAVNYQQSPAFSNLATGTYTLTVKNSFGCISPSSEIVVNAQPPTPAAPAATVVQPSCSVATGTISVTPLTGNQITYSINGISYQGGSVFNNVAPGTYSLTAKNADGCISPATSIIVNTQPITPAAPVATANHPTCTVATGTITLSAQQGLTYSIDGISYQALPVFGNLVPGTYSLSAKNAAGCISPATTVTINPQPQTPAAPTATVIQPNCSVAAGTITVTPSAGLTYSINGSNYQSALTFSNIAPGVYNLTAKSASGCVSNATSVTVNAQPLTPGAPAATATHPTCTIATGTITVSTPTAGGLYSIDGSNFQVALVFNSVPPGTYHLRVKNVEGCISPASNIIINALPQTPAAPTATVIQPTCTFTTGTITVLSAGTGLTYSLDGNNYQTAATLNNVTPGSYNLTVKNAAGCLSASSVVVVNTPPPTPIAPTASVSQQPNCTTPKASITIAAPIGAGLEYSINGGANYQTGLLFNNVTPGTYPVTVRNNKGCISPAAAVTVNPQPATSITTMDTIVQMCPGSIFTLPSGNIINTAGFFRDTMRYANGGCDSFICTVRLSILPAIRQTKSISICSGRSYTLPSGQVVSTSGNYIDTIRYRTGCDSLITATNLTVASQTVKNITATLCAGQSYTLPSGLQVNSTGIFSDTLKSTLGCDSLITIATISVKPVTTRNTNASICFGQSYTLASGLKVTTPGMYKDTIRNIGSSCDSLITNVNLTVQTASRITRNVTLCIGQSYTLPSGFIANSTGVYVDTVRYRSGCDSVITTANVIKLPTVLVPKTLTLCPGQTYTLPSGSVVTSTGTYGDTLHSVMGCDSLITLYNINIKVLQSINLKAAICEGEKYKLPWGSIVSIQGVYVDTVRTAAGCDSLVTRVALIVKAAPSVNASKSNDINCSLAFATLRATGGSRYSWTPSNSVSNSFSAAPTVSPTETTKYKVQATGANGCIAIDSITVNVSKSNGDLLMPNAFTPNADGKNDCFSPKSLGDTKDLFFAVYNRWGEQVFSSKDPAKCWDGTFKGLPQSSGTFVYQVNGTSFCGPVNMKGTVILIR